jgi:hypothetical protein
MKALLRRIFPARPGRKAGPSKRHAARAMIMSHDGRVVRLHFPQA